MKRSLMAVLLFAGVSISSLVAMQQSDDTTNNPEESFTLVKPQGDEPVSSQENEQLEEIENQLAEHVGDTVESQSSMTFENFVAWVKKSCPKVALKGVVIVGLAVLWKASMSQCIAAADANDLSALCIIMEMANYFLQVPADCVLWPFRAIAGV